MLNPIHPDHREEKLLQVDTAYQAKIKTATLVWSVLIVSAVFAIAELTYRLVTR